MRSFSSTVSSSSGLRFVDGIASTGVESGGVIPGSGRPSVETIGEFRLIRGNFNAEYGRTGGGVEIFTTRSGTNQLHGSLFDYLRNDKFDARGFFQATRPINRQNEFGGVVGGSFGPLVVGRYPSFAGPIDVGGFAGPDSVGRYPPFSMIKRRSVDFPVIELSLYAKTRTRL